MILLFVAGCNRGPPDPRPELAAAIPEARPVRIDPDAALREDRWFEACSGFKQRARASMDEAPWIGLLITGARDPNCLDEAAGDRLAGWARARPGWGDAVGEWEASRGLYVDPASLSPASRLRVALRGTDQAAAVAAAEDVLAREPGSAFACAVVVQDLIDRGELAAAIDRAACASSGTLARLRAQALDEAGREEEAVAAYDRAGFGLHAAAILYQRSPPDLSGALARMDEEIPPVAIHRGWMAVLAKGPVSTEGLDDSPESTMIRAIAGVPSAIGALPQLPGLEPKVLHARLTGNPAEVEAALAASPDADVLLRANLGIRLDHHLDPAPAVAAIALRDADHVRLFGVTGRREAPWAAIAPWTWAALAAQVPLAASGHDDVGACWRAAAVLDGTARDETLADLQVGHPELRGLARVRAGGDLSPGPPRSPLGGLDGRGHQR